MKDLKDTVEAAQKPTVSYLLKTNYEEIRPKLYQPDEVPPNDVTGKQVKKFVRSCECCKRGRYAVIDPNENDKNKKTTTNSPSRSPSKPSTPKLKKKKPEPTKKSPVRLSPVPAVKLSSPKLSPTRPMKQRKIPHPGPQKPSPNTGNIATQSIKKQFCCKVTTQLGKLFKVELHLWVIMSPTVYRSCLLVDYTTDTEERWWSVLELKPLQQVKYFSETIQTWPRELRQKYSTVVYKSTQNARYLSDTVSV